MAKYAPPTVGPAGPVAPVAPAAPVAPVGPAGPVAPAGPAGPIVPAVPGSGQPLRSLRPLRSRRSLRGDRNVNLRGLAGLAFSFESIVRLPPVEVSARPWLLEGVVTQPCTREVISTSMNWLMVVGVNEATLEPRLGMVEPLRWTRSRRW